MDMFSNTPNNCFWMLSAGRLLSGKGSSQRLTPSSRLLSRMACCRCVLCQYIVNLACVLLQCADDPRQQAQLGRGGLLVAFRLFVLFCSSHHIGTQRRYFLVGHDLQIVLARGLTPPRASSLARLQSRVNARVDIGTNHCKKLENA